VQKKDFSAYFACPACDLLHLRGKSSPGTTARCTRCGTMLYRDRRDKLDRSLSLVITGLILLFISNYYPFLTLEIEGRSQETVLFTGIVGLYVQGQLSLAVLVLLTGLVCPLLQLVGLVYILLPLRYGAVPPYMAEVYRWVRYIQPWSMMEILMLGILVSLVKLVGMADVVPGPSLFAFMALIFTVPAATVAINTNGIWERSPLHMEK
jgi:paraquat-inducible protein A